MVAFLGQSYENINYSLYLRYPINIPVAYPILSAYLEIEMANESGEADPYDPYTQINPATLTYKRINSPNVAPFNYGFSSLPTTTKGQSSILGPSSWMQNDIILLGSTLSLQGIVTRFVNLLGYQPGNYLGILINARNSDGSVATGGPPLGLQIFNYPKLTIVYEEEFPP